MLVAEVQRYTVHSKINIGQVIQGRQYITGTHIRQSRVKVSDQATRCILSEPSCPSVKEDLLSAEPGITANENSQTSELTRGGIHLSILT